MKDDTPSKTAVLIAHFILVLGGDAYGRQFCPPGSVEATKQLMRAARLPFWWCLWYLSNPFHAKLARWAFHNIVHPLFMQGIGIRKVYIEEVVRKFIHQRQQQRKPSQDGQPQRCQVVVLGAGYDTLTMRLATEYPQVEFWEIDHPATAAVKQKALRNLGFAPNIHLLSVDLAQTGFANYMRDSVDAFDPSAFTIVVMEGLTMYLSEETVRNLFADVARVSSPQSQVVFDYFGWRNGRVDNGWMTWVQERYLGLLGEPWKWGKDPQELPTFFAATTETRRWRVVSQHPRVGLENCATVELLP